MENYSDNEIKMFKALGYSRFTMEGSPIDPWQVYQWVAAELFMSRRFGAAVEAFRRGCKAFIHSSTQRLTPEFDKLIEIKEKE